MSKKVSNQIHASGTAEGVATEGHLFRSQLGENWGRLAENIRNRFDHNPVPGEIVRYRGVMSRIECSLIGKILARFVQYTGALMPYEGRDVPVDIEVWTEVGVCAVFKRRVYQFPHRRPFVFYSKMMLDRKGDLVEFVGGGFGMRVRVGVDGANLSFRDDGYFFEFAGIRLPMPDFLSPGRVLLKHVDRGPTAFSISIEIRHPWYGLMYYQEGIFNHDTPGNST